MIRKNPKYLSAVEALASEIPIDEGRFLITGASGLIGSCIVDVLSAANSRYNKKFCIYALGRSKEKLVAKFGEYTNVEPVAQSITEPICLKDLDYIIHAASNADPKSYALYPAETMLTNVIGAKNVLDYCRENKTRALLTSSFEVYGKLDKDEYVENEFGTIDLNLVRSCYPESKRTAEMLFKSYYDEYKTDAVIARLPSVYGPTMQPDDSKAHAQFLRNALAGEDIVLKSKGTQKRSYCYVMDVVSGLFAVLFKGKAGEAYNIACDFSTATIAEVAQTIADYVGTKVVFDNPDPIESKGFSRPQNCVLNTEKIKSLGWSGKYDLKSGIADTINILIEEQQE